MLKRVVNRISFQEHEVVGLVLRIDKPMISLREFHRARRHGGSDCEQGYTGRSSAGEGASTCEGCKWVALGWEFEGQSGAG